MTGRDRTVRPDLGPEPSGPVGGDPSTVRTLLAAAGIGVLGIVLLQLAVLVVGLTGEAAGLSVVPEEGEEIGLFPRTVLNGLGQIIAFGGLAAGYLRWRGNTLSRARARLGIHRPSARELGVGTAGLVGMFLLLVGVGTIVSVFTTPAQNTATEGLSDNPQIIPAMVVVMLLIVGPFEELLYRGVVQTRLRERFSVRASVLVASLVFAVIHAGALQGTLLQTVATVVILFTVSLVLGYLYEYTGNLVIPALVHGLYNSVQLVGTYAQETGTLVTVLSLV